ncbi:MAG: nucleotidyltransferase domain-containing protein [Candidatus Diapherotrites archaeon]|nr:nucleotidyltransferase domain-containing protein [Candidatus Micrarchaeota archaeon]
MAGIDFLNKDAFRLLELLLDKKYYLRELAEKTGMAPSSVHNIIALLAARKIVIAESQKNRKFFRLNYGSPLTASIMKTIFVDKITSAKAFKKLVKLQPIGIYLFGTAASGKMSGGSDIDLAIYFEEKPGSLLISQIKRELSNELKMEVQLIVLTKTRVASMERGKTELLQQIKNKSIVLEGDGLD